jgi:hypothetical protein
MIPKRICNQPTLPKVVRSIQIQPVQADAPVLSPEGRSSMLSRNLAHSGNLRSFGHVTNSSKRSINPPVAQSKTIKETNSTSVQKSGTNHHVSAKFIHPNSKSRMPSCQDISKSNNNFSAIFQSRIQSETSPNLKQSQISAFGST